MEPTNNPRAVQIAALATERARERMRGDEYRSNRPRIWIGRGVLALGALAMVFALLRPGAAQCPPGNVAALAMFLLLLGAAMQFPSMLRDDSKDVSSMRVVLFVVAGLFCVVTIKAAWNATALSELSINGQWAALLASLILGKAVQTFSEAKQSSDTAATVGAASERSSKMITGPAEPPSDAPPSPAKSQVN